jgi:ABC-2 type transport system ATP-binding protein
MKCVMDLITPESWSIKIFWEEGLTRKSKQKIWFMPENTYLYKHLTWEEFLKFNWKFFWLSWEELDNKIKALLEKVWLTFAKDKYLSEYSKWMLQRVWLAQAIINEPKLVFLDEPMSGLDPIGRKMVKNLIVELKKSWTTVLFNTHILADVESICDRISIIHKWEIIVSWEKIKNIDNLENYFIEKVTNTDEEAIKKVE